MDNLILGGVTTPPGFQAVAKVDANGKPLFLLPQPGNTITVKVPARVKVTAATSEPSMVPQLTPTGETYEVTQPVEQPDGSISQEGTGHLLPISILQEVQEKDDTGKPLYWKTVQADASYTEPQPPLEIAADDPAYTEGLEPAYTIEPLPAAPEAPREPTLQERFAKLEDDQKALRKEAAIASGKIDATTADLGGFMDLYFTRTP